MKKALYIVFFICTATHAQIGIGTTSPEAELHVVGDMLVQNEFTIGTLPTVSPVEEDFKLVTRVTNTGAIDGEITKLNVDSLSVAPVNTIDYHIRTISLDNVTDLDLQYDESKYVIAVSNFRYVGDPIEKTPITDGFSIGHFVVHTFANNGTWHLEIRNRGLDLKPDDTVEYYITLVVYDKSFYRQLPTITTDLGGNNSGTASSIPDLYN